MKKIAIALIRCYQNTPTHIHNNCRFIPTCSEYMILSIERFGFITGLILGIKRILRCNPWGGYGYDPVKERKTK